MASSSPTGELTTRHLGSLDEARAASGEQMAQSERQADDVRRPPRPATVAGRACDRAAESAGRARPAAGLGNGQEAFFSTAGVHFLSAYDTGYRSPSSRSGSRLR